MTEREHLRKLTAKVKAYNKTATDPIYWHKIGDTLGGHK